MKKLFLLTCFLWMIPFIAEAQVFSVYDIDKKDYPVIRARYLFVNEDGEQVYNFRRKDLNVFEYEEEARILSLKNPRKSPPKKLSVLLVFDVSGSMSEERLEIARAAGLRFIDLLPLEVSECAISSFDHMNYLNSDFTHSEQRLKKAIRTLKPQGGTSYNSGFINPHAGAFQIAKEGKYKKVVIFLTDGLGEGNASEIISQAEKHDIIVYPVTVGLGVPDILKTVALKSGGRYFGEVTDTSEAKEIYNQILLNAQSLEPGEITWRSPNGCHENIETLFSYKEHTVESSYKLSDQQRVRLDVDPAFIHFEPSDTGERSENIELTARNSDFTIQDIVLEEEGFSLENPQYTPFQVKNNSTANISLNYDNSPDNGSFTPIKIINDQCPDYYIYAKAGSGSDAASLELITPNGDEVYSAGLKGNIEWEGISERDSIAVWFSPDTGETWQPVGTAGGLSDEWKIPAVKGTDNLIRIEQSNDDSGARGIETLLTLSGTGYSAHNARFVGKGQYILTVGDDHSLKLWDAKTGEYIRSLRFHADWVYDAVDSPDGKKIVSASDDGTAMIFSLENHGEQHRLSANYSGINKAIFSNSGAEVITASDDGALRIWDANTGRHKYGIRAHSNWVLDVDQSPNGKLLASGGDDGVIRIFRYNQRTRGRNINEHSLRAHNGWVTEVEFSPDGTKIISASRDGTVRLWDTHTGSLLHTFNQHNDEVYSAGFSPDGNRILTTGRDGILRLWDLQSKHMVHMLKAGEDKWYRRAYFGPDGNRIITINNERKVEIWVINDNEPFQEDESDEPFRIVSPKPALKKVDFGDHITGVSVDTLINNFFRNPRDHSLRVNNVFIGGADRKDFSLVSGHQSFTLHPGKSKDIELNYSPKLTGSSKAYLGIVTPTDTVKAPLLGKGIEKDYSIPADRLNFGSLKINQERDTSLVFIENNGSTSLAVEDFNIEGAGESQFAIKNIIKKERLSPGASKRISLAFNPTQGGRSNAVLAFRVDDRLHKINLFGKGLAPREIHLEGKVLTQSDHQPLSASIQSFDSKSNRLLDEIKSGKDGRYSFTLNPERAYRIVADKEGYIPGSIHLDLTGTQTSEKIVRDIYLPSIDSGSTVVLNNIFFEYAKARLTQNSQAELDRMGRFLEEHPGITIQLSGHTDSIGTRQNNLVLSKRRAQAVKDYLIEAGISPERMTTKGFGETQPVAENDTPEGRQKNRRVEFTITSRSDSLEN
ncbi:MAG: OmpA family protein [Bacteroidota bacterium]